VVYQPTRNVSLYAQYATGVDPLGTLTTYSTGQVSFSNATGNQIEIGAKATFLDGHGAATIAAAVITVVTGLAGIQDAVAAKQAANAGRGAGEEGIDGVAGGAAAVAAHGVAVVAHLVRIDDPVAALFARFAGHVAHETRIDNAAERGAAVIVARVAVVASLAAFEHAIAALLAAGARNQTVEARLYDRAAGGAAIAAQLIAVVTRLCRFQHAIAATGAGLIRRTSPACLDGETIPAAAVTIVGVAIVAKFVRPARAIPAFFAG